MGCICLRQIRKDTGATNGELYGDRVVEVGFRGDRKNNYKLFYSGELLVLPAKAVTGKELYHELHALDRYEQDCRRKLQEEELIPASKQGSNLLNHKEALNGSLGASGLALHYANIINQIDNIVSRPLSLPPTTRDSLYWGLPIRVKVTLHARMQSSDSKEEYAVPHVKAEMQKILRWLT